MEKILRTIARISHDYHKLVIVLALLLTLAAGWLATGLKLDLGFLKLMPQDDPYMKRYREVTENSGGADSLIIVLKSPDLESAKRFADALAPKLKKLPEVIRLVDYKINIDFFEQHGLLYLAEKDLIDLKDEIADEKAGMKRIFGRPRLTPFLAEINDRLEDYTRDQDLAGEEEEITEGLEAMAGVVSAFSDYAAQGESLSGKKMKEALEDYLLQGKKKEKEEALEEEYYIPDDKSLVMMMLMPTDPHHDMSFFRMMVARVKSVIAEEKPAFPNVRVKLAGMAAMMDEEWNVINRDMRLTGLIALAGVLLLFIFSFRMLWSPVLAGIPLVMGIVWNFGIIYLTVGRLNVITSVIAAILFGLGIDFAIHIISRYTEERIAGQNIKEALEATLSTTGQGILLGGLTTAVAFYGLMSGEFQAMREMGFITGTGVMACLLAVFFVLPALLRFKDERARAGISTPVSFAFMEKIGAAMTRRPKLVIVLGIILTLFFGYYAARITFEYDMLALMPRVESVKVHKELMKKFDRSLDFAMLMNADLAKVRRISEALEEKGTIKEIDTITHFIPTDQEKKLRRIRSIGRELGDLKVVGIAGPGEKVDAAKLKSILKEVDRLRLNFMEISDLAYISGLDEIVNKAELLSQRTGKLSAEIKSGKRENLLYLERVLGRAMKASLAKFKRMTRTNRLGLADLPQGIKEKYLLPNGQYLIYAFPKGNILDELNMRANRADLFSVDPGATGTPIIWTEVLNYIRKDLRRATVLVFIAIFLMVLIAFRSIRDAIITLIPVSLGTLWMVGLMSFAGIKLNFSNMAAIPMILGIGIDDGVHIVHRYRLEGKGSIPLVMRSTGRAVLLTTLTTMIGFGTLGLAADPYVASLGIALAIGVGLCLVVSATILPALLKVFEK